MSPATLVLLVFFAALSLHLGLEELLAGLNIRVVRRGRGTVPGVLQGIVSPETHARGSTYICHRGRVHQVALLYGALLTIFYLFSGILGVTDRWVAQHVPWSARMQGVVLLMLFAFFNQLAHLPFQMYSTFVVETRFGFNKTTAQTFWLDKLKAGVLGVALGVPFLYGLLWFMSDTGPHWWLWAAGFVVAFQGVVMLLYPVLIAPLFNKFTPLADGDLKRSLEELAARCHFAARGIFVMDGSKRSAHSNAYFTGFGRARRIVLFDTLIQQMSVTELAAVLAHEIGHYKRHHIYKGLALSIALTIAGFYVLSLLLNWPPLYRAFDVSGPAAPMGLLLFSLIVSHLTFWAEPLFNGLSRKYEYEADAYAAAEADGAALASALIKLHEKNLQTAVPHPAYSAYHYSHPTLFERVGALRNHSSGGVA